MKCLEGLMSDNKTAWQQTKRNLFTLLPSGKHYTRLKSSTKNPHK